MIDSFGRNIVKSNDGGQDIYTVGGMQLSFPEGTDESFILNSFNAMAPEGWSPPAPPDLTLEQKMQQIADLAQQLGVDL